ncbi:hypothetical protein K3495_g9941 [Podosphaera aphanis]|nr:hypothetical protein K3495_g9941 [Podosphaera aphanis]
MSSPPNLICPKPRRPIPLDPSQGTPTPLVSPSPQIDTPSRTHSFLNLTSSTLRGIFSPRRYDFEQDNLLNSMGTSVQASQTTHPSSSSFSMTKSKNLQPPTAWSLRIAFLFGAGMSYGFLIKHLHDEPHLSTPQVKDLLQRDDWVISTFWGLLSMLVGCLLPHLDYLFSSNERISTGQSRDSHPLTKENLKANTGILAQDWTPVIRSIGAFVGIACAIRKLPWASTLQASIALSMVNLALWFLIDRSITGFVLSTVVSLIGTPLLHVLNPELIPHPMLLSLSKNICTTNNCTDNEYMNLYWARGENPEALIWILSVLFCSCVCFGNIGRKFAFNSV